MNETQIEQLLLRLTQLERLVVEQAARIKDLEEQLAKNSRNSSKPPSSDGPKKGAPKSRSLRKKSGKQSGGQKGHKGQTLNQSEAPDKLVKHTVDSCHHCHGSLASVEALDFVSRQVFEVPQPQLEITECNAHHLRELNARIDNGELWASQMKRWMLAALNMKYEHGEEGIHEDKQNRLLKIYDDIVARGLKYHESLTELPRKNKRQGKRAKRKGHNLVLRLKNFRDATTRFITAWNIPFTNNLAEQDLRMMKVQQKISGCFRSWDGARIFARHRTLISTARKQGWSIFQSIKQAVSEPFCPNF